MPESFAHTTISAICDVFDGPHATPTKTDFGPYFLSISSLKNGRIDLSESAHLNEEDFVKWTRRVTPRAGDVVFSYETRLGEAALIPDGLKCCLGRRMALMRPKGNAVDSTYLLYHFLGPEFQDVIRARTVRGSTTDRIALIEFPSFPISVPPLPEQKAIAHILRTLDDKIELNRKMNETLEAMARALFKSWFVDFDPVRKKLAGQPTGLPPEIEALFPGEFEDSALGKIPKGWRVGKLGDITDFRNGKSSPERYPNGLFPVYGANGIIGYSGEHNSEVYDTVIGRVGSYCGSTYLSQSKSWVTDNAIVSSSKIDGGVYSFINLSQLNLNNHRAGSGQPLINQSILFSIGTIIPNESVVKAFELFGKRIFNRISAIETCQRQLTAIRDTLLPKLISGELRVKDAERFVGDIL